MKKIQFFEKIKIEKAFARMAMKKARICIFQKI
jgi:hypothetical protein